VFWQKGHNIVMVLGKKPQLGGVFWQMPENIGVL
jgi:hypothetical protein